MTAVAGDFYQFVRSDNYAVVDVTSRLDSLTGE
jgi:hypothetical protein